MPTEPQGKTRLQALRYGFAAKTIGSVPSVPVFSKISDAEFFLKSTTQFGLLWLI